MKKLTFFFVASALFAACQPQAKQTDATIKTADSASIDTLLYQGEGPAADGTYKYSLAFYGDECSFTQVGVTPNGIDTTDMASGLPAHYEIKGKKYIRVSANKEDSVTFRQVNDSTLVLVSNDFEEATPGLETVLKLQK